MEANTINLPKKTGRWTRSESPRAITSNNIFEYMDGAGELYLGYRFNHLDVFDYTDENRDSILVELYHMETSDDAFGLLSLDWEGEAVSLMDDGEKSSKNSDLRSPIALYGAGLLRVWTNKIYARIMAYRETPEAKQAVIDIGRAIVSNRKRSQAPEMLKRIPQMIENQWRIRKDKLHYFRSFQVLNSIYYISHENILDLDTSAEAVAATYEYMSGPDEIKSCQFLLIKYKDHTSAVEALKHFNEAYLSDFDHTISSGTPNEGPVYFEIEEGWLAYKLFGGHLVIVSGCPNRESSRIIIERDWSQ